MGYSVYDGKLLGIRWKTPILRHEDERFYRGSD